MCIRDRTRSCTPAVQVQLRRPQLDKDSHLLRPVHGSSSASRLLPSSPLRLLVRVDGLRYDEVRERNLQWNLSGQQLEVNSWGRSWACWGTTAGEGARRAGGGQQLGKSGGPQVARSWGSTAGEELGCWGRLDSHHSPKGEAVPDVADGEEKNFSLGS
eukprot:591091-Hanusia_phi.AAC.1